MAIPASHRHLSALLPSPQCRVVILLKSLLIHLVKMAYLELGLYFFDVEVIYP